MATSPTNPFGDVMKTLEQFKLPGVDMSSFVESGRKDMQAIMEANQAAYETMQALARKQTEMISGALQSMQETAKSGVGDPSKQGELMRKAYEKALADLKDIAEMARQSQADGLARITERANQHMEEIKKLMKPGK
jgi:phasin family protein